MVDVKNQNGEWVETSLPYACFTCYQTRLDLMLNEDMRDDDKKTLEKVTLPLLHLCISGSAFRNSFYNAKAMQKLTQLLEENSLSFEATVLASHLIFCLMFKFSKEVDVKFAKQFIRSRGPEIVMQILKHYTEHWKMSERELVVIFLPMIGLSELPDGKAWLKKNWVSVSEYVNFLDKHSLKFCLSEYSDSHWCPDCDSLVNLILEVWGRFHSMLDEIQTEERQRHMTELLQDEEREKEKQAKRKEKRRQKKNEKINNTEDDMETIEGTVWPDCQISDTFITRKNENSNAGQEDTNQTRKQKNIADVAKSIFQISPKQHTCPIFPTKEPVHASADFPELTQGDIFPKTEQWTTIQTKRQIQKEKEKKQSKKKNETIQSDILAKTKKTPKKSPRKKNIKTDQSVAGHTFTTAHVSAATRWADIAKGKGKVNIRPGSTAAKGAANYQVRMLQRPDRAQFGEQDFPSLHGQPEQDSIEKKSYIKPAKFTFHFHDPIDEAIAYSLAEKTESKTLENKPAVSRDEEYYLDSKYSDKSESLPGCVTTSDQAIDVNTQNTAEVQDEDIYGHGEPLNDQMVRDWVETEMSDACDDGSGYMACDYDQTDDAGNNMHEEQYENNMSGTDYNRFQEGRWDDEPIQEYEAPNNTQTQPNICNGNTENYMSDVVNHTEPEQALYVPVSPAVSESVPHNQSPSNTRSKDTEATDYVGPEHCQVDINTIIQHQTMAFPCFQEVAASYRDNDPFFDPSVPLPKELRFMEEEAFSNCVDALFENSEEIPSWFMGTDAPSHEATWNDMQESSEAYAERVELLAGKDDFSSFDPAIIGYKNMTTLEHFQQDVLMNKQETNNRNTMLQVQDNHTRGLSFNQYPTVYDNEYINEMDDYSQTTNLEYDNAEKQTAIIKPLQSKSKKSLPVVNSAFGQNLLENACRLERDHVEDSVGYPEDIGGEPFPPGCEDHTDGKPEQTEHDSTEDTFHFPAFHADTKLSGHINKQDISVFHLMQQVQLEQLSRYYNQNRQTIVSEATSRQHDTFAYYASCAGMNSQNIDDCLYGKVKRMNVSGPKLGTNTEPIKTFKEISIPVPQQIQRQPPGANTGATTHLNTEHYHRQPHMAHHQESINDQATTNTGPAVSHSQKIAGQPLAHQLPHLPLMNLLPGAGQFMPHVPPHPATNIQVIQATQAAMAASVMNQIQEVYQSMIKAKMKSIRWKDELWRLRNLPTDMQTVVGKIVIPKDGSDRIYISHSRYVLQVLVMIPQLCHIVWTAF